jgi:oxygen-dependent protoporphyrinogen oxidase
MDIMIKHIIIIGGGISGLSCLHYLKRKYVATSGVRITLLEAGDFLGGTARSIHRNGFHFETGPNGFLASLELVDELGISDKLLVSNEAAKIRYISIADTLYQLPAGLGDFFRFPLLSFPEKIRILGEFFVPKRNDPLETVFEFGQRRLGRRFAEIFLDSMVTGIFAGDVKQLHLASAFPKIHNIEQKYGSLFFGMLALAMKKRQAKERFSAAPRGQLTSFQEGMSQFVSAFGSKYADSMRINHAVERISQKNNRFKIYSKQGEDEADEVIVCTPAYAAAQLLKDFSALARQLERIPYAPIAVAGLVYKRSCFKEPPRGFGYLIPSSENREVLGVLFTSNIFDHRTNADHFMFRVMIGGVRHPDIIEKSRDELIVIAKKEIEKTFKVYDNPVTEFFSCWHRGIPQYNREYPKIKEAIETRVREIPGLQ